ncbi:MarR family winged helix-turn-helix transcriptional regulator [Pseudonocardia sp. Cha107L01]|uniref:MarR family winged helix-turn-helix transcriptional regulator n=1 Tax=Pseudonocardia sp. Cha107L01 TaxID=3457576 RepID=UPI00403EDFCF
MSGGSEAGLGADRARESDDAGSWLSAEQLTSWLSLVGLLVRLPAAIDSQLQRDANLGMVEYQVLAMLAKEPVRTLRMSVLAAQTGASISRLSHLVTRMERRELIRREPDAGDGRFTNAVLTDEGMRVLAEAAPAHVAFVRNIVIDALTPERLRRLGQDAQRIITRIEAAG